jgi:hypothetical protein
MKNDDSEMEKSLPECDSAEIATDEIKCPVCGATAIQEKCKLVCRSEICRRRIIMNCAEF